MEDPNILTRLPDDGRRGPRLEIDEFVLDNPMTNLFLIALASLQEDSYGTEDGQRDGKPKWTNYYNLAGIHGLPAEDWDGIKNLLGGKMYCHHEENTFPTWHRAYIFLYELAIYREMIVQAKQYTNSEDQKLYEDAAARFRLPYWDLVMPRNKLSSPQDPHDSVWGCPEILKKPKVFVKKPNPSMNAGEDGWDEIENPLYSFRFPSKKGADDARRKPVTFIKGFDSEQTQRIPGYIGESKISPMDLAIQRQATTRATLMWQMLNPDLTGQVIGEMGRAKDLRNNDFRTWESFANSRFQRAVDVGVSGRSYPLTIPSLESWHNGLHVMIGTGQGPKTEGLEIDRSSGYKRGHMGHANYAAFDPIFWLHHNNIDRLFALYQALFRDKYTSAVDSKRELTPFKFDGDRCWTSGDEYIKNYWHAGFAVPGNRAPSSKEEEARIANAVKKYLSNTYYWATNGVKKKQSLPSWPKVLVGSWALHGRDAVAPAIEEPTLRFTSIQLEAGVPTLLSQTMSLVATAPAPEIQPIVIHSQRVLEKTKAADDQLPTGAFLAPSTPTQPTVQITWNANVKVRKYAFNQSFSIHLFIGWVKDEQPERFMTKKNEVGFTGVFASDQERIQICGNCARQQEEDMMVDDVIPLTTMLFDYLDAKDGSGDLIRDGDIKTIPDLTPENVVPFLREQLRWRMIDLGANLLANQEQHAGLEITVTSRPFIPPTPENVMGVYGPETTHISVTDNKQGGYGFVYPTAT